MSIKILYVRHGKSIANATAYVGVPETPLAEEGIEQAFKTGQDLKSQNITAIVVSPFIRAQQTAEIIAAINEVDTRNITTVEELHERRMGIFEGKPKEIDSLSFTTIDSEYGFETHAEIIARSQIAIDKVKSIARSTSGTTIVVGHGCAAFFFQQVAKGYHTFAEMDEHVLMGNAEFFEVELED